jgi:hypothetical protein
VPCPSHPPCFDDDDDDDDDDDNNNNNNVIQKQAEKKLKYKNLSIMKFRECGT